MERDAIHPVGGWIGPVRVWQPLPSLSRRRRGRLGGAPVRGGHVGPAHSVPRRAPGCARSARTHTRPRMAAGDRARPGRGERGAARSACARQPAPHGAGAARVAGWTASGVRAGRREGDEHAARARRRNGTPARRPPRQWGRGLRLAGRYPRGHAARLHEPLADPERPLPLGTGTGVAAHDARRSSGRARSGRRTAGCDCARPRFGPPDGARARCATPRSVGGCDAVARWTLGGWQSERGRSLGPGALAGGFAR